MAAKKKAVAPRPPAPKPRSPKPLPGGSNTSIDAAVKAIQARYKNNVAGAKTLKEAAQGLKDVVAESSLVDKYSKRTLDAAAVRVAQNSWNGMQRANKYGKGRM